MNLLMNDEQKKEEKLGWKDYIALIIAFLTTILLPLSIIMLVLVVTVIIISRFML